MVDLIHMVALRRAKTRRPLFSRNPSRPSDGPRLGVAQQLLGLRQLVAEPQALVAEPKTKAGIRLRDDTPCLKDTHAHMCIYDCDYVYIHKYMSTYLYTSMIYIYICVYAYALTYLYEGMEV